MSVLHIQTWCLTAILIFYLAPVFGGWIRFGLPWARTTPTPQPTIHPAVKLYPSYFRTREAQDVLENAYCRVSSWQEDTCPYNGSQVNQTFNVTARRKRAVFPGEAIEYRLPHSCCLSYRFFVAPCKAENVDGNEVNVVQLPGMDKQQFFLYESCEQTGGCNTCQCKQPRSNIDLAVIDTQKSGLSYLRYKLEFIKLPGCCKCI